MAENCGRRSRRAPIRRCETKFFMEGSSMEHMKQRLKASAALAVLLVLALAFGASAASFGKDEMRRMGVFISNFTEVGLYNFDLDLDAAELIRFGIQHNYLNNYKSRIKLCKDRKCPHGDLTIEGKFVVESVKKYFDLDLENQSVTDSDPRCHFDGKLYHFEKAEGETVYYADVQQASREGKVVNMSGELYNVENKKERPAKFQAVAKPYNWKGKDTWAILSLRTDWND